MKKHEVLPSLWARLSRSRGPECFQVVVMRLLLLIALLTSTAATAQDFSAPPLVQADTVDPSQGRIIPPPVITNAPLDPNTQLPASQPVSYTHLTLPTNREV